MDLLQSFQNLFGNIKSTFQNAKPLTGKDKATEALNIPRLAATAKQSLASQNIKNPYDFFKSVFNKAPENLSKYIESTQKNIPIIGGISGPFMGAMGQDILGGASTFFQKKPLIEHGADILKTVGAVAKPVEAVLVSVVNPAITTATTLATQRRLPTGPEFQQSIKEGVHFGNLYGPISKIVETPLKPLLEKISPVAVTNINAYLNLAKNAVDQTVKDSFYKLAAKRFVQNVGAEAIKGFFSFGAYGGLQPARNYEERIAHALKQGVEGAVLSGGMKATTFGVQGLNDQIIQPGLQKIKLGNQKGAIDFNAEIKSGKMDATEIAKNSATPEEFTQNIQNLSSKNKDTVIKQMGDMQPGEFYNSIKPPVEGGVSVLDMKKATFNLSKTNLMDINQAGANVKYKLSEVLDSPELYKKYPELKDLQVRIQGGQVGKGGHFNGNEILLDPASASKQDLIHEIQHFIQRKEGMPTGAGVPDIGKNQQYLDTPGEIQSRKAAKNNELYFTKPASSVVEGGVGGIQTNTNVETPPTNQPPSENQPVNILDSKDPINVALDHMTDLTDAQKEVMRQKYIEVKATIEKDVVGKPITDAQVLEGSVISHPLDQIRTPAQTQREMEAILSLEKNIADAGKKGKLTPEFIDSLKVLRGEKSYAGRLLRTFGIDVESQGYNPIMVEVTKKLQDIGMKTDEILKAAEGLNWDNPKDVGKFYREFVKPTIPELLDEYRYINMLSSPKTHLINLFSNVIQTGFTAPATKLYSGAIDFVASKLTGAERTHYVSEVPAFYRGAWNSIGDAVNQAKLALKGETFIGRPDINRLPTGNPILSKAGFITKALEASDVFFRTLIKSGEMESLAERATKQGKEVVIADIEAQANKNAAYYIFRQNMPGAIERQGKSALNPLNYMDSLTNLMYDLRSKKYIGPIAKFMIPFIETPTNILKQGFEYSPMGLTTIPGAKDKTEQLAKALLGSTIVAGTAFLTSLPNVEITWSAPTDKTAKDNFYQSDRQPFTLRVGDKSIAYNKLGPLSYPIALVAAWKYYSEKDPESITENTLQKLTKTLVSQVGFFANQSYMEQLGNLVDIAKSGTDITKTLENIGADVSRQLIPLAALQSWVARIIDPVFRKTEGPIENIISGLPGLSTTLPPYTNVFGKPEERNNRIFNAFSPVDIGNVNPDPLFESIYTSDIQKRKATKISAKIKSGDITPEEGMKLFQKLMQSGPTMSPQ